MGVQEVEEVLSLMDPGRLLGGGWKPLLCWVMRMSRSLLGVSERMSILDKEIGVQQCRKAGKA